MGHLAFATAIEAIVRSLIFREASADLPKPPAAPTPAPTPSAAPSWHRRGRCYQPAE